MGHHRASSSSTDPSQPPTHLPTHTSPARRPAVFLACALLPILGAALVALLAAPSHAPAQQTAELALLSPQALAHTLDALATAAEKPAAQAAATAQESASPQQSGAAGPATTSPAAATPNPNATCAMPIQQDIRPALAHGPKGADYQRYIVLHDTEGTGDPASVVDYWDSTGTYVAAHFVVGRDGTIVQCVPLDAIAHHAGFGDAGHNQAFNLVEDGRDDLRGTRPIGSEYPDYAMNAHSVGIELVHSAAHGDYPQAQLDALDALIGYIDSYYGFESPIICHRDWRSTNSDTSELFAPYLAHYQATRTHA